MLDLELQSSQPGKVQVQKSSAVILPNIQIMSKLYKLSPKKREVNSCSVKLSSISASLLPGKRARWLKAAAALAEGQVCFHKNLSNFWILPLKSFPGNLLILI